MTMRLSAHQPAYLPWLGYFDKIWQSDLFVYLDGVQFEKNSFTNRNQIKTPQGGAWLTVPVKLKGHLGRTIREIEIENRQNWQKKHLQSIYMNYKKAPRFEECFHKLEMFYQREYILLDELCWDQLQFWLEELGIPTQIVRQSELDIVAQKSDLVLELCRRFNADHYLSGTLGRDYLDEKTFAHAGIKIAYQEYQHPVYPQLWGKFVSHLSIVDFWMNSGDYSLIPNQGGVLAKAHQTKK